MVNFICFILGFLISYVFYYSLLGRNPYKSELNIGKKGAGKTTDMCRNAFKYIKKGWNVYCNKKIPGTYLINASDIGKRKFPPNSVILIDEAGLLWNNRNWKTLGMDVISFMKLCRHERNKLILYTQSNNEIDVSFMRVCDKLNLIKNKLNVLGTVRHLTYKQVLIPASETAEARITDDLVPVNILLGGLTIFWMPKYWKYFDSYDSQIELEHNNFEYIPFPVGTKPVEPKEVVKKRKKEKKQAKRTHRKSIRKKIFRSITLKG